MVVEMIGWTCGVVIDKIVIEVYDILLIICEGVIYLLKVIVTSLFVEDQEKALKFYTEKLEFAVKHDVPVGEFRWIALVSGDTPEGIELLLEPNNNPTAKEYQQKLFEQGIPATMFGVEDIQKEYERLLGLGVRFTMEPTNMGEFMIAVFDDTCGNLIQIIER